jgi:hypothetical protein
MRSGERLAGDGAKGAGLPMYESVILVVAVMAIRLVCCVASSLTALSRERARCRALVALFRAAGPGSTAVVARRPDGSWLCVRTQGRPAVEQGRTARR